MDDDSFGIKNGVRNSFSCQRGQHRNTLSPSHLEPFNLSKNVRRHSTVSHKIVIYFKRKLFCFQKKLFFFIIFKKI